MTWLGRLLRRRRLDADLDRELRFHVDEEIARLVARGVPADEARRQALAAFGGYAPIAELTRDARGTRWVGDLWSDVRFAVRMMRKSPGFAVTVLASLAIGIGANAAVFSVTDALLRRPLPIARPDELYFVNLAGDPEPNYRLSGPEIRAIAGQVPDATVTAMSPITRLQSSLDGHEQQVDGQLVLGNWFQTLGVAAAAGRLMTADDTRAVGGADVAVLSHGFWDRQFGRDPRVIGAPLVVNGRRLTIVGVAADGFTGVSVGESVDVWLPLTLQADLRYRGNADISTGDPTKPWWPQDGISWLTAAVRIPPDHAAAVKAHIASVEDASLARIGAGLDADDRADLLRHHAVLEPGARGQSSLRGTFAPSLTVLAVTTALVLLIACANLASLLLARSTARQREFALRLSIGARRGRLIRQMLTESLLLAVMGGALGVGVAAAGARALLVLASSSATPIPLATPLDWRLVAFALAVSLATGVLFGLGPALRMSRAPVHDALRPGTRGVGDQGRGVLTIGRGLVVAQVALSLALLIGAALFTRTLGHLLASDLGFDEQLVIGARFDLFAAGIPQAQWPDLNQRLIAAARAIPGVDRATLALNGPLAGGARVSDMVVEGLPEKHGVDARVREDYVGPDYFATTGTARMRGRDFDARDDATHPRVAIVNQTMVARFFGDVNPIGHRIGYGPDTPIEVVGVVRDAKVDGATQDVPPEVYYPLRQYPTETVRHLYVRVPGATGLTSAMAADIRAAVAASDSRLAVSDVATLEQLSERRLTINRIVSELTGVFGLLAVAVACLGLFGTLSYAVSRRTQEIGVRLALGAGPWLICGTILRDALSLVAVGCAAGVGLALLGQTSISTLLYGLSPRDPLTFAGATTLLMVVATIAALIPAWRAARIDPLRALRAE